MFGRWTILVCCRSICLCITLLILDNKWIMRVFSISLLIIMFWIHSLQICRSGSWHYCTYDSAKWIKSGQDFTWFDWISRVALDFQLILASSFDQFIQAWVVFEKTLVCAPNNNHNYKIYYVSIENFLLVKNVFFKAINILISLIRYK